MELPSAYSLAAGTISGSSQIATLSISSARLVQLQEASKVHLFTCMYEFGDHQTSVVTAVQSITLFSPGYNRINDEGYIIIFNPHFHVY